MNYSKSFFNDQCDFRYKMSLFIINDQTIMHTNFYVAFCFMSQEISVDYTWILNQLKMIYVKTTIFFSTVIVIDMKKKLMSTIQIVFSSSIIINILCLWHINKNVLVNCKKSFAIKKEWEKFFTQWQSFETNETSFWISIINRTKIVWLIWSSSTSIIVVSLQNAILTKYCTLRSLSSLEMRARTQYWRNSWDSHRAIWKSW
jgi:hypothetical protein